jgi:hypothetical protein
VSTVTSEAGDEEVAHGEHVIVCSVFFFENMHSTCFIKRKESLL